MGDTNLFGYVQNDPVNWTDPSGLKYRRCSRPLNGLSDEYGDVRHDYLEFDDGTQYSFNPAPGESYIEGISTNKKETGANAVCRKWSKDSKSDAAIKRRAERNLQKKYQLFNYNCQDFVDDSILGN